MAEDMIELPDDEMPAFEIAEDLPDEPGGDLDIERIASDDAASRPSAGPRTPIQGHVAYVRFELDLPTYLAYYAWCEKQEQKGRTDILALPESQRIPRFFIERIAADCEADDARSPEAREYDWVGIIGRSFGQALREDGEHRAQAIVSQKLRLFQDDITARLQAALPDWSPDQIHDLIGPLGSDGDE